MTRKTILIVNIISLFTSTTASTLFTTTTTTTTITPLPQPTSLVHIDVAADGCDITACLGQLAQTIASCGIALAEDGLNPFADIGCLGEALSDAGNLVCPPLMMGEDFVGQRLTRASLLNVEGVSMHLGIQVDLRLGLALATVGERMGVHMAAVRYRILPQPIA